METNSKDFGAPKNSITGKTIRDMTWGEIFSVAGKRMTHAEAMKQIEVARIAQKKGQSE